LGRWSRRNPAAAALTATALALVGLAIGGGFWLERERAERHAESVRQEERETRAVEAALEQSSGLGRRGRWPDALAVLDGALSLLSSSAPANLRERLMQARSDAKMADKLEEVRLRLSTDPTKTRATAAALYSEAFRNYYGIDLLILDPEAAAARVGNSAIHETLLAYLHDWHYWALDADRAKLRAVLDWADDDPWRRAWRQAVAVRDTTVPKDTRRMVELAAWPEALAQPPLVLSGLGGVLLIDDHREESLAFLREAQQRHPEDYWLNYLLGQYWEKERPQVAVGYFRAAVAIRPSSDEIHTKLGRTLLETGDAEGAIAAFRQSVALNPNSAVAKDLAWALAPSGGLEEARAAWEKVLQRNPPDHDSWYGYAQLCLFLGNEEAYRQARKALLERFGETTSDWIVAERTSLACLLLPDSCDELRGAIRLADFAVAAGDRSTEPGNPYLRFLKGLAVYRDGRPEEAVPLLQEAAEKLPNRAGPRLALAMALFQSGSTIEARKTLAAAVRAYDWNEHQASRADHPTVWVCHVLRREAEALILPNLPAFLQGTYQPQDNDERLALLGICRSRGLCGAAARLFADAFDADPALADELTTDCLRRTQGPEHPDDPIEVFNAACRYLAARCAALAGCGFGKDGAELNEAERTRWRKQARQWLRAELVAWARMLDSDSPVARNLAKRMLTLWLDEPDLAGLRDPAQLERLAEDERKDSLALWAEVGAVLARCGDAP
jgi:serine/threonine-protein kinase